MSIACSTKLVSALNPAIPVLCLCLLLSLPGCNEAPPAPPDPIPTFQPKTAGPNTRTGPMVIGPTRQRETVASGPSPPVAAAAAVEQGVPPRLPLPPVAEALSLEQVALPAFINEVFSKTLNLTVQIDQRVVTRTDIVTLRTGRRLPAEELFRMAQNILAGYGVGASWDGSVLHIAPED